MKYLTPGLLALALLAGCSSQAPAPEEQVTSQEIENGASSIIPIGAVAHMFGGSEKESLEIGTGEYNKKLDAKIAEIQKQCNIQ